MNQAADVVIVGAGVVGLATAFALRERGASVAVLERDRPGAAQSTGPSRIFRHIHETDELVRLALRAGAAWRAAEERHGVGLLGREGVVMTGDPSTHARRLSAVGAPHELLDAATLREAIPALGEGPQTALLDPAGGVVRADTYVEALAAALADTISTRRVSAITPAGDEVVVVTDHGRKRASAVLVCAGAGTPPLAAGLGVQMTIETTVHHRVTFGPVPRAAEPLPCLLERSGAFGARAYALRTPTGYAVGCATFDGLLRDAAIEETRRYVSRALPGVPARPGEVVRCESVVLDGHPENFALASAGNAHVFTGGNLFKFAPLLGELLADALLGVRLDPVLTPRRGMVAPAHAGVTE